VVGEDGAAEDEGVVDEQFLDGLHRPGIRLLASLPEALGDPLGDAPGRSVLARVGVEDVHRRRPLVQASSVRAAATD
jgi:hypothetical protein